LAGNVKKIIAVQEHYKTDTVHHLMQVFQLEMARPHGKSAEFGLYQRVLDTCVTPQATAGGT
jgi:hypothetical protein